jgi:hypothetical protein
MRLISAAAVTIHEASGRNARLDRLSPMHLSRMVWLLLGALAYLAWVLNAVVEGSSTLAIIIGPLLIFLWVAAVLVVDCWVTKGVRPE